MAKRVEFAFESQEKGRRQVLKDLRRYGRSYAMVALESEEAAAAAWNDHRVMADRTMPKPGRVAGESGPLYWLRVDLAYESLVMCGGGGRG